MLPAPGSPTFIPSLLQYLQSEINGSSSEWTIDPSLFSALLLAQIAGPQRGGVIVDVLPREGKKKGMEKVVGNVVAVCPLSADPWERADTAVDSRGLQALDFTSPPRFALSTIPYHSCTTIRPTSLLSEDEYRMYPNFAFVVAISHTWTPDTSFPSISSDEPYHYPRYYS